MTQDEILAHDLKLYEDFVRKYAVDFHAAVFDGDKDAQMRTIVAGLATHVKCLVRLITDPRFVGVRPISEELADAALEFLETETKS